MRVVFVRPTDVSVFRPGVRLARRTNISTRRRRRTIVVSYVFRVEFNGAGWGRRIMFTP